MDEKLLHLTIRLKEIIADEGSVPISQLGTRILRLILGIGEEDESYYQDLYDSNAIVQKIEALASDLEVNNTWTEDADWQQIKRLTKQLRESSR